MPKTTIENVIIPGFAQPQDITVSAALDFRPEGIVVAKWRIDHKSDNSALPPRLIDEGSYVFPSTPAFVEASHQKFFDMVALGLLEGYLARLLPVPPVEPIASEEPVAPKEPEAPTEPIVPISEPSEPDVEPT